MGRVHFLIEKGGIAPTRKSGDAGFDFYVPKDFEETDLQPGDHVLINSKVRSKLEDNIALIAFNKSGVATKKNLQVGACVVDPSYQGEIHMHVFNWGKKVIHIAPGDKLVQFVPVVFENNGSKVFYANECSVEDFYEVKSERGEGGFGSTGDKA